MREDDYDPLTGYRTRTGDAQGGALERKLLGRFGTVNTSRTAQHIHPNGDVTTVNTKNGMPEVVTTKAPVQEEGDYSYEIVGETTVDYFVTGWRSQIRAYKLNISKFGGVITCTRTEIPIDEYTGVTGTEWKKYHRNLRWVEPATKRFVDFRGNLRKCGYGPLIGGGYNAFWGEPFLTYQGAISGVSMGSSWFDYSGTRVLTNVNYVNMDTGYVAGITDLRAYWTSAGYGDYVQGIYSPANPRVQYAAGVCLNSTPWSERINGIHRWDDSTGAHETLFTENATGTRGVTYSYTRVQTSNGTPASSPPSSWSLTDNSAATATLDVSYVHEFPVGVDVGSDGIGKAIVLRLETVGDSNNSTTNERAANGENVNWNSNWKIDNRASVDNDYAQTAMTLSLVCGGTVIASFNAYDSASNQHSTDTVIDYSKVDGVVVTDVSTVEGSGVQTYSPTILKGTVMSHPEARVAALFVRRIISNPPTYTSTSSYASDHGTVTDNTTVSTTRAADSNILTTVVVDFKNGRTKEFSYGMFTTGPTWTGLPADAAADFITTSAYGTGYSFVTPPPDPNDCGGSKRVEYILGYNGATEGWFVTEDNNLDVSGYMPIKALRDDSPHGPDGIIKPATVWANDDLILFSGVTPFASFAAESSHHFYIIDRKTGATKKIEGQGSYWKFYEALKVVPT